MLLWEGFDENAVAVLRKVSLWEGLQEGFLQPAMRLLANPLLWDG